MSQGNRNRWAVLAALAGFALAPGGAGAAAASLYDRLGGAAAVQTITANAIDLYLTDPRLHSYFDDTNPEYLKPRFATYICKVADGPCIYRGRSMAASHKGLHIDEAAFDAVVEDLQIAMNRAAIPFWTQNQLLARLAPMERDIVTR